MYTDAVRRLRRAIGLIAMIWLVCQTSTLVLATAAFGINAVAEKLLACTCAHGTQHTDCPMHHPASSRQGLDQVQCTTDTDFALLGSLLGHLGLPTVTVRTLPPALSRAVASPDVTARILRPAPPEPPPPRV